MYFMQNGRLREMEKLMQRVPNFRPRGCGVITIKIAEIPPSTFAGVMMETASAIRYRPFRLRLHQYLKESEDIPMIYKNDKHRLAFEAASKKEGKKNYALLSALYLLTADGRLWRDTKRFVVSGCICFEQVHLPNCICMPCVQPHTTGDLIVLSKPLRIFSVGVRLSMQSANLSAPL